MQKIVNVLAIASTVVSATVVGGGLYIYLNRTSIIDGVKSQVMESVLGGSGGLPGMGSGNLPLGTNDLAPTSPQAAAPSGQSMGLPIPGGF
tara:strand:- start:1856 stop:2128 length:273 start_codon:yes stop_codon:yes gene_type:complete